MKLEITKQERKDLLDILRCEIDLTSDEIQRGDRTDRDFLKRVKRLNKRIKELR